MENGILTNNPRISDLISRLEELKAEHGDLPILTNLYGVELCLPM